MLRSQHRAAAASNGRAAGVVRQRGALTCRAPLPCAASASPATAAAPATLFKELDEACVAYKKAPLSLVRCMPQAAGRRGCDRLNHSVASQGRIG